MAYQNLLYEVEEGVATITVNRPKLLNALSPETMDELRQAFQSAREDSAVKGVILTGAGEKAFVAGADISQFREYGPREAEAFARRSQDVLGEIEAMDKPVVAAVNGYALGGGCELAMACHMRVAGETARLGQPEVSLGIIPGNGGTQRLPRLVGKGRAFELILTGRMVNAVEAEGIGLVNRVVPSDRLMDECRELLQTIFEKGPIAVSLSIDAINYGYEVGQAEGLVHEASLFGMCFATEDMREGTQAFVEKRKPHFKGR